MIPVAEVREATVEDAITMAPNLREADLNEVQAASGLDPCDALTLCVEASVKPYVAVIDEDPILLCGAVDAHMEPPTGVVWMLGTDRIQEIQRQFLREGKDWLGILHEPFDVLWNLVDKRNELHIKWLKWMGFQFLREVEEHGFEKRPFYEFVKVKD